MVFTDGGWIENFRSQLAYLELQPGVEVAPRQADSFHHVFPVAVVGKIFMPEKLIDRRWCPGDRLDMKKLRCCMLQRAANTPWLSTHDINHSEAKPAFNTKRRMTGLAK